MPATTDSFDFSVDVRHAGEGGRTVVAVAGEVDLATAGELEGIVLGELARAPVLVDLGGVAFLDSSGVRALDRLLKAEGDLRFSATLQDPVAQVLRLTGMHDVLPFAGEEDGEG